MANTEHGDQGCIAADLLPRAQDRFCHAGKPAGEALADVHASVEMMDSFLTKPYVSRVGYAAHLFPERAYPAFVFLGIVRGRVRVHGQGADVRTGPGRRLVVPVRQQQSCLRSVHVQIGYMSSGGMTPGSMSAQSCNTLTVSLLSSVGSLQGRPRVPSREHGYGQSTFNLIV